MLVVELGRVGVRARARRACLIGLVAFVAHGTTFAQSGFQVPPDCGSQAEFSRELERLLGGQAMHAEPLSLAIDGGDGPDYRLRIVLREGTRELRHTDCRTLFRSAVVIAAASYERERRRHPTPSNATVASPTRETPERREPQSERSVSFEPRVAAGVGASLGPLPGAAPLFELSLGVVRDRVGLLLAVRYLSGTEERKASGHGVMINALGARALVSFEPWHRLRAAAGAGVYRLNGHGRGTVQPLSDATVTVEPVLEISAVLLRGESLELELGVGAHFAAVRPRFLIGGFGEVYEVPAIGGEGLFRIIWLIP
jgi:hypothetical protein